jgi:hypothetical protein
MINKKYLLVLGILLAVVFNGCEGSDTKNSNTSSATQESNTKTVDPLASKFSYNGEHYELAERAKGSMHDPNSYEFVSGEHWTNESGIFAALKYRGTNAYGAVVTEEIIATLDSNGNIVSISR